MDTGFAALGAAIASRPTELRATVEMPAGAVQVTHNTSVQPAAPAQVTFEHHEHVNVDGANIEVQPAAPAQVVLQQHKRTETLLEYDDKDRAVRKIEESR
jgi:hypothetical protein